jgi:hypothetical protein
LPLVKALDHKIPLVSKVRHAGPTRVLMRIKRRLKIDEGNVVQWIQDNCSPFTFLVWLVKKKDDSW